MHITYSRPETGDADRIYQLCRQLILDYEDPDSVDLDRVLSWVRRKIHRYISGYSVICVNGSKAGYYRFYQNDDSQWELDDLYIFPEFQDQGIGSAVIQKCLDEVDAPVYLYVFIRNRRAVSLYSRLGFQIEQTVGQSRYIMKHPSSGQ